MWYKLPIKDRMELMKSYRKGGYSYRDMVEDYNSTYQKFANGGEIKFTTPDGEKHVVYVKDSPTGMGKGVKGHIMVNHPTKDKGKWDTIDLTEISGAKTVAQGKAATLKWHKENPQYANGGEMLYNPNKAKNDIEFQNWYTNKTLEGQRGVPFNLNNLDYDYYSYYKNTPKMELSNPYTHFPDTYKLPVHSTFSNESLYSTPENPGGYWKGEKYIKNGKFQYANGGKFPALPIETYNPSETVQSQTMSYINNVPRIPPVETTDLNNLSKQKQIDYGINKVIERERPEKRKALETLLRTTSWMENNYGANPKAYNRDYTNSFMSLDDIAVKDLFTGKGDKGTYTKNQLDQLKRLNELGLPKSQDEFKKLLRKDDSIAAIAGARMVYGSSPEELPDPNNPQKVFDYYYKYYNKAGASKYGDKQKDYNRFLEGYKKYGPQYKTK